MSNQGFSAVKPSWLKKGWQSGILIIGIVALINLIMHLLAIYGFGWFRDEFYYIACSDHPALGYVDHPPLAMWLLKVIRTLLGSSRIAIRIVPVLAAPVWIFTTGLMARSLGGRRMAMFIASAAAFSTIGNYFLFGYYSMNFWDMLFWQACFFLIIRIVQTGDAKYWLFFGLTAGLGLMNKISVLFLLFGLGVGILMTRERKQLAVPRFWLGMALALLLFSPYVIWNAAHNWAHLEFIEVAKAVKMAKVSPAGFFTGQLLHNNPASLLIWLPGLLFFFFHKKAEKYRLFGWLFLSIYIVMTLQQAKAYYLAPAYPVLFAGGGILWETWLRSKTAQAAGVLMTILLIVQSILFSPLALPVLSAEKTIAHIERLRITPTAGENHETGALPQHFADMHGWDDMVKTFSDVHRSLPPEERKRCILFVTNYGEAGAVDFLGRKYDLPMATCGHNNYWLWGPPEPSETGPVIVFGWQHDPAKMQETLEEWFEYAEHAATFTCGYCMPYENNRPVFICRHPLEDWHSIWPRLRHYD